MERVPVLRILISMLSGATTVVEGGVTHDEGGTLKFIGGEHVVLGGTEGNDKLYGIDSFKGVETPVGDDLQGGNGNDTYYIDDLDAVTDSGGSNGRCGRISTASKAVPTT